MITQSAFLVENSLGRFIGIVAFDSSVMTAIRAARLTWGEASTYKELDAYELAKWPVPVFTASVNE